MDKIDKNEEIENRISEEIIVDAYNREEQAMGWYYYTDDHIEYPFQARCIKERTISPLNVDEVVEVIGMPDETDCRSELFVLIKWQDRTFGVPLAQLEPVKDEIEAVNDWHYWVNRGYEF